MSAPKNKSDKLEVNFPSAWRSAEVQGDFQSQNWLSDFNDPILVAIIEEALTYNQNLKAAEARLRASIAGSRFASSNVLPSLNGTANKSRNKRSPASGIQQTPTSETHGINLRFNWEIDIWGKVRNGYKGDLADIQSAKATYDATRLSIAGRVAQSWYNAVEAQLQYDLAVRTQEALESGALIVEENFKRGIARALDVRLVRANVASNQSTLEARLRQKNSSARLLETLLGRYPANELMAIGQLITKEEVQAYNDRVDEEIAVLRTELSARESEAIDKLRRAQLSKVPKDIRADMVGAIETPESRRTEVHKYLLNKYEEIAGVDLERAEKSDKKLRSYRNDMRRRISLKVAQKKPIPNGDMAIKLPDISGGIPAGVPSELLLRRPDIIAAERTLAANEQRKFETSKARIPSLNISLSRGTNVRNVEDILDLVDRRIWSQGIVGSMPFFQGGRLRNNFKRGKANYERAIYDYGSTVLTAFREVENALNNQSSFERDYVSQKIAADESAAAEELAWEEYGRGLTTITTALDAVRRNITAQRSFLQVSNQRVQSRIDLYLALGGGFDVDADADSNS
ncbi:MAG: TolC family protein [Opitutales bacterium]|nr:TolC family protein [Opitutales bacterium]